MSRIVPTAIAVLIALPLSGCIPLIMAGNQSSKDKSRNARMLATARAEEADKKALEAIQVEAAREEEQAVMVENTNPRAGCVLRAQSQHKACRNRSTVYAKSHSSVLQRMADPKACEAAFETANRTCKNLPETASETN